MGGKMPSHNLVSQCEMARRREYSFKVPLKNIKNCKKIFTAYTLQQNSCQCCDTIQSRKPKGQLNILCFVHSIHPPDTLITDQYSKPEKSLYPPARVRTLTIEIGHDKQLISVV
jgi:hypothetical protein